MSLKNRIAGSMRTLGLGFLVDSLVVRKIVGAPLYSRHSKEGQSGEIAGNINERRAVAPDLTVVVPAYNVEKYLRECVDSILNQNYGALRVIIVDDGSTDSTPAIADQLAAQDVRVSVVHKVNAGLGAARNTGLDLCKTQFITFVDSDDIVMPNAYTAMIGSLRQTGSDVAIGGIERFNSTATWTPFWVPLAHSNQRLAIKGTDFPPIMWDVFAWNKIYRRNTWDRLVGAFPEGILYEDQECTTKLYVGGAKVDILTDVVYRWRFRDEGGSITQNKTSLSDLADRASVARSVEKLLETAPAQYREAWYTKTIGEDFSYYIKAAPRATEEFWAYLRETLLHFYDNAPEASISAIHPVRRILAYIAGFGNREMLLEFLAIIDEWGEHWLADYADNALIADIPPAGVIVNSLPGHVRRILPDQASAVVCISGAKYSHNGDVTLLGYAFFENISANTRVEAWIDVAEGGVVRPRKFAVKSGLDGDPTLFSRVVKNPYVSLERVFFSVDLDAETCDQIGSDLRATESASYPLRFRVIADHLTAEPVRVIALPHGAAETLRSGNLSGQGNRWALLWDRPLSIKVLHPRLILEAPSIVDGQIQCEISIAPGWTDDQTMSLIRSRGVMEFGLRNSTEIGTELKYVHEESIWTGVLSLMSLPGESRETLSSHILEARSPDGLRTAIALKDSSLLRQAGEHFSISSSAFGYAQVDVATHRACVINVDLGTNGQVVFEGTFFLDVDRVRLTTPTFALVNDDLVIRPKFSSIEGSSFRVGFSLVQETLDGSSIAVRSGSYIFEMLLQGGTRYPAAVWVETTSELEQTLPQTKVSDLLTASLEASRRSRALLLRIAAPLAPFTESGGNAQFRRSSMYFSSSSQRALTRSVVFESFGGAAATDSCRALDTQFSNRASEFTRYWSVKDMSVEVPVGATPLVIGSERWFQVLSTAQILVNNNNFPSYFRKDPRQLYVQTWHGTPMKKIGNDVPPASLSLRYRALMDREVLWWDLMLAQSPEAGNLLTSAFGYTGAVVDLGYPRNDNLVPSEQSAIRRNRVRNHLGVNDDSVLVLYAPTWRDNIKDPNGRYLKTDYLDLPQVYKVLSPNVTVLYRGHANAASSRSATLPAGGVIDVTRYPDVNDLILASDLLVTDYSSIMFDYCVTGKPMVFVVPDLDVYGGQTRGFYYDFAKIVPGPVLFDPTKSYPYLKEPALAREQFESEYGAFVRRFAPFDDGHAAERVFDRIIVEHRNRA